MFDNPFDLRVVPVSALPLTMYEIKKAALSVDKVPEKKEEKKRSRQDIYAGGSCFSRLVRRGSFECSICEGHAPVISKSLNLVLKPTFSRL